MLITSWLGVPSRSVMSSSWCTTLRPGNSGLPSSTSAKMQPMLQMSMAGLQGRVVGMRLVRLEWGLGPKEITLIRLQLILIMFAVVYVGGNFRAANLL